MIRWTIQEPEKVAVVTEVRERFDQAGAAILTEYRGLTVKEIAALRRSLGAAGGDYRVYKNTLVRFAARDLGLVDLDALLDRPDGDRVRQSGGGRPGWRRRRWPRRFGSTPGATRSWS